MPEVPGSGSDAGKERSILGTAEGSSTLAEKIGTLSSLRISNFRFFFVATILANAAQWIQQVTLSWLVYDMTGSGTILGTINMARSMVSMGTILIAGVLIDRLKRRLLVIIENGWLCIISLALGLALLFGQPQIWYLFVFSCLGGMAQTIDMALQQVLVFDLVPRSHTPNAMALVQTGWSVMRSLGPGIGGFLIAWFGPGGNFVAQAGAYALIIITIMQIRFPARKSSALQGSPLENIKDGFRHLMKENVTRIFMMLGFVLPLFIIPIYIILPPIYAVEVFGDGSGRVLGFLMASVGVGGIVGGFVTASLGHLERRGLLQLSCLFLLSMSLICFALSKTLLVALLFLAFSGFFEVIFLTTNQTLLQLSIPDELRGRLTSIVNLNVVFSPLGGFLAGVGSDLFGGPKIITIILAGIVAAIAVFVFLCSPTVRNYRLSKAIAQSLARTHTDSST